MAFVENKTSSADISSKRTDFHKKKTRTFAKQQQISENISKITNNILAKAQESVSAIEELKSAMEQITVASEQNASASEQSLKIVTVLNNSIQKTMNELKDSVTLATNTKVNVEECGVKVIDTAKRMQLASQTVANVEEKSTDMKKASDNIGQAVGLIAKISDQTNLLALNAAIEAAKAKEHGKGFAVVAAETRELAAISTSYADAIREVVSNIQESIEKVEKNIKSVAFLIIQSSNLGVAIMNNIQSSMTNIQLAIEKTILAVKKFETLSTKAADFYKGSESIASASEESASAVAQITNSIDMQVNALHEAEESAAGLYELAQDLRNSTDTNKDAEEISSSAEELISIVEEIQKSMQQAVVSLEQINGAAQMTLNEAKSNQALAKESLFIQEDLIKNLDEIIEYLIITLKDIKDVRIDLSSAYEFTNNSVTDGQTTKSQMKLVNKEANKINKTLVKIINTNTQTTMLAVSGSVEAARAGESGKGFAVVSGDIRSLAQDAGNNMDKVQDVMDGLENEIVNIELIWNTTMQNQESELSTLSILENEIDKAISNVDNIMEAFKVLKIANEKNQLSIEEALAVSGQIESAASQSLQNTKESGDAANLINDTISEMAEYIEDLAVSADELQQ